MPVTRIKPLHVGTSLSSLKPKYDIIPENKDPIKLCRSASKLFDEAKNELQNGDEERAYIFYMRYLNIASYVSKLEKYKKSKSDLDPFIPKLNQKNALEAAEKLSKSLVERYEELKKGKVKGEVIKKAGETTSNAANFNTQGAFDQIMPNPRSTIPNGSERKDSISSMDLFKHLGSDPTKVLIMDVRPQADFEESHIDHDACISIPDEVVILGYSASKLAEIIPPESQSKWKSRLDVEFLVLMDWFSPGFGINPDSKLNCLQRILEEWDPVANYRCKPLVLGGGYDDFLNHYPGLCTNPKPRIPSQELDNRLSIDDVVYPIDLLQPSEPTVIVQPSALPKDRSAPSIMSIKNTMPSVDRGSKAAALQKLESKQVKVAEHSAELARDCKVAEEKLDELKRQEEFTSSENDKLSLNRKIVELTENIDALHISQQEMDKENNTLRLEVEELRKRQRENTARMKPKPTVMRNSERAQPNSLGSENVSSSKEKDIAQEGGESNVNNTSSPSTLLKNNNDLTKSSLHDEQGVSSTLSALSGLKRSRSSPNIAQLDRELDVELESCTPRFDRSSKPALKTLHNTEYINRPRNFHEVYGNVKPGLTGLKNLGNSCYMNSILQCVSNSALLNKYFCTGEYINAVNRSPSNPTRGEVVEEVAQVVRNLWIGHYRSIACRDLKAVVGQYMVQFRGTLQQDSHEFLTFLLDWLHNDLKGYKEKNASKVSNPAPLNNGTERDVQVEATKAWEHFRKSNDSFILTSFFVQQVSTVRCDYCSVKSFTYEEPTSNLTLLLPSASRCSLVDCLRLYTNRERISGYKCESCHGSREADKKIDLCRLPPILVIHLKRFYSDGFYQKRQTFVDFPLTNLDLSEYTLDRNQQFIQYNLYGVSNHYGTLEGGHYTAFCKNGEKWYKYDDQDVSEISASEVKSSYAYILFYAAVK